MTNREEANKLASKITGETVNADTTKKALDAITGKSAGSMAEALENIVQSDIGGDVQVEALSVTENGTYTAPEGTAYNPVTVNVPSGGGDSPIAYGWDINGTVYYFNVATAPDSFENIKNLSVEETGEIKVANIPIELAYTKVSDTEFTLGEATLTREPTKDFTLW